MIRYLLMPLSWILNWVPRSVMEVLSRVLGWFFFSVLRFRRKLVLENLALALGKEKSKAELHEIAWSNYQHYALVVLEWIQSLSWTQEDFKKYTTLDWDPILENIQNKKGGILFTSHLGNWEFAIQAASASGMPCDVIVKKQRTRIAQDFLTWFRTRFGARIIYETGTLSEILASLSNERFVVFVIDQYMGPPIGLPVSFFGKEAGTAVGLALISEKSKTSLFTSYNYRGKDGRIHVYIKKVEEPSLPTCARSEKLYLKTQWFNDILESQIRMFPEQWLWLHRRWKAYQGEPRWKMTKALALVILGLLTLSCSSQKNTATPTGISLPEEPVVSVPLYGEEDSTEIANPNLTLSKPPQSEKKVKSSKKAPEKKTFSVVPTHKIPFEVGERLVIDLTWLSLPAGQGTLEVRNGPSFSGRPTYHLWGNVLSSKMVDTIYHVDNTIESFVDAQGFIPYKFLLSMFETAQKKETRVVFDHPKARTNYWSKRISQKWGDQEINREDEIIPQSRDMFSALYYARALDYEINKKQMLWIYENGQNLSVELLPLTKEVVTSGAGVFQCWKIKVDVRINNVLKPTGDLFMWLSDDSKKYLVKFDAKVKIGSLLGKLVSIKER